MMDPESMADAAAVTAAAASALPAFDNASVWHNLTAWTAQRLGYAVNMSRLTPSLEDLVWAGPRMVMKLGSFISFPDAVDGFGQRVIAESTDPGLFYATTTADVAESFVQSVSSSATPAFQSIVGGGGGGGGEQDPNAFLSRFSGEGTRGLTSLFSYATSKWALCCVATAVILNRTQIYAATRRRVRLLWRSRLVLRIIPLLLLVLQARRLLQSIQCQTSPDFAELRWGNASKSSDLMFSQSNGFLHGMSSALLLGASDEQSCRSVRMIPWDDSDLPELRGSLSRLFPLFVTFCVSQFVETLSCAVQGRIVAAEFCMNLFEHSLAFAEADAAVSNQLGWSVFANSTAAATATATATAMASPSASQLTSLGAASAATTRALILKRVNTPPEVLLVAFLSSMGHITNHILAIFNLQSRSRLISTGFWALCFMGSMVWSASTFSLHDSSSQGLLRYPTVCIIGFIPHILILAGILMCWVIYMIALALSAVATPTTAEDGRRLTFMERLALAHGNMQANAPLSDVRIRMDMDFYTALLRAGFAIFTMASEAVYLNEDRRVNLKQYTWLEDERFRELEETRLHWTGNVIPGSRFDRFGTIGLIPIKEDQLNAASGYARERAAQTLPKSGVGPRRIRDGIGAAERSGRWLMALEYVIHINRLLLAAWAVGLIKFLVWVGVRNPPGWLRSLSQRPKAESLHSGGGGRLVLDAGPMYMNVPEAQASNILIPRVDEFDVEAEVRRRLAGSVDYPGAAAWQEARVEQRTGPAVDEAKLDGWLYSWWAKGGWWGEVDESGDYVPETHRDPDTGLEDPDFDTTSVVSASELGSNDREWETDDGDAGVDVGDNDNDDDDYLDDGQRTPTQRQFGSLPPAWSSRSTRRTRTREPTPFGSGPEDNTSAASDDDSDVNMLSTAELVRLLDPTSPEAREEALALAAHLSSRDGAIVTRSRFRALQQRQRAQLLLSRGGTGQSREDGIGGGGGNLADGDRGGGSIGHADMALTPEEEARRLEQILLSRRAAARKSGSGNQWAETSSTGEPAFGASAASSWATGAPGLGADGPQCVVCQSSPRTIIVWPCRCLSLCDDCRVSLAMNNFDKCVCCRREVVSFSRIYVP